MRRNNKNKIIIFSLIGLMFLLVVGYAAFQTKLEIKGTSNISSEWRIEITDVTLSSKNGLAESVTFEHTTTTASMETNLYEKGDYAIYNVEVSNLGSLDATIDNIANNIKSSNEAVKISFSGYTKGQILKAKEKQIIKVKIEYDSNYDGEVPTGPAEVEIQPEYVQQSPGSTQPAPDKYLVSYDCETNGGSSCSNYNEYMVEGSTINLGYTVTAKGYKFIGWNTDKTAISGLTNLSIGTNDVTLYAIYERKNPPTIDNVSTSSTTKSITVAVAAHDADSRIVKYEYSVDGTNYFSSESNTYTFNGLTQNKTYTVYVKVTNEDDLVKEYTKDNITTSVLEKPTFTQTTDTEVTINYPEGCGNDLTCTYEYNDKASVPVTSNSVNVPVDQAGNIVAKVSDSVNTVSSNHTVLYNDLYVSNTGSDSAGYGTKTKPYSTTGKAYTMATNTASIKVMDNITSSETTNLNQNKDIILTSYSTDNTVNSITRGNSQTSYVLNQTGGNLKLKNITIDGNNVEAQDSMINVGSKTNIEVGTIIKNAKNVNDYGGGLSVINGGTLTMNDGEISNNNSPNSGGAGVFVFGGKGTFIINGGSINDNSSTNGGAIWNAGKLEINGGSISYNNGINGGGIYSGYLNAGTELNITGGVISNNTATNAGGGIIVTNNTSLNINEGTISNNKVTTTNTDLGYGGGLAILSGTTTIIKGTISNNTASQQGGGIYNGGNLTIKNILVDSNEANGGGGGAGIVNYETLIMDNGTISNNIALYQGGGIRGGSGSNTTINGGSIFNNSAKKDGAGGIAVDAPSYDSTLTINGGNIYNNTARFGGGISVNSGDASANSTFVLNGGTIKNNIATSSNGGIFKNSSTHSTYTYKSGTVCGNTPANSYETHATCPAS